MILRTLRAVVLTALTWGFLWGMVGLTIGLIYALRYFPDMSILLLGSLILAKVVGIVGLFAGGTFAAVVALAERGKTFETLSLRRAAAWGAFGGVAYLVAELVISPWPFTSGSLPAWLVLSVTTIAGACGALSAAGSLAIARKGTPGLLEAAAESKRLGATPPALPGPR